LELSFFSFPKILQFLNQLPKPNLLTHNVNKVELLLLANVETKSTTLAFVAIIPMQIQAFGLIQVMKISFQMVVQLGISIL